MSKQRKSTMPAVHAKPIQRKHAAGIDIGATSIYVAVPVDRDPQPVRSFQTFTEDLHRLADWLQRPDWEIRYRLKRRTALSISSKPPRKYGELWQETIAW